MTIARTISGAAAAALLVLTGPASADTVAEHFSYKAPSGMFSEGTTKWQLYQFIESDAERTAQRRAGEPVGTGSISNSNSGGSSYPRPGEPGRAPRRATSH